MRTREAAGILFRYIIILLAGLGNLFIFYKLLTPLTVKSVYLLLNLFSELINTGNIIIFREIMVEIIPACVAGSAYYLLFVLVLSTPNIKIGKRLLMILFSFSSFFILNILRLVFLIFIVQSLYFEFIHLFFWYILSTLFVAGIWLYSLKIFKIKDIPVYSDVLNITKSARPKRIKKRN